MNKEMTALIPSNSGELESELVTSCHRLEFAEGFCQINQELNNVNKHNSGCGKPRIQTRGDEWNILRIKIKQ